MLAERTVAEHRVAAAFVAHTIGESMAAAHRVVARMVAEHRVVACTDMAVVVAHKPEVAAPAVYKIEERMAVAAGRDVDMIAAFLANKAQAPEASVPTDQDMPMPVQLAVKFYMIGHPYKEVQNEHHGESELRPDFELLQQPLLLNEQKAAVF